MNSNIYEPDFDVIRDDGGFRFRRAFIGKQAGGQKLGGSLFEILPGDSPFPFHFHHANEELAIVVRGRPHLRRIDGWTQLDEGEVVAFPVGEGGAHQFLNRTDEPVRVLIVSEMNAPEIVVFPDSGKVSSKEQAPGPGSAGLWHVGRLEDGVDYLQGETPPDADAT